MGEIIPEKVYDPPVLFDGECKCELCGDTGYRHFYLNGHQYTEECECFQARRAESLIRRSGVSPDMTFQTFSVQDGFQKNLVDKAHAFIDNGFKNGEWFVISGQVGSGKTHLCTAIVNELLSKNVPCRYMMWKTESVNLKAMINSSEFADGLAKLTQPKVLYIDDFLKTQTGYRPSAADINLAFQILNDRYIRKMPTLLSCEISVLEIMEIDEAVGSRIYERSRNFRIHIEKDKRKNYRLRK